MKKTKRRKEGEFEDFSFFLRERKLLGRLPLNYARTATEELYDAITLLAIPGGPDSILQLLRSADNLTRNKMNPRWYASHR